MCVEIIVAIIGILGSIAAGFIAYYKTKKLRFFDAYFENKVRAYNDFWIVVSELRESPHNSETRGNLRTGLYRLGMFSNEDVFKKSQDFGAILLTYSIEPGLSVELEKRADDLMQAMRKDIDNCKKVSFPLVVFLLFLAFVFFGRAESNAVIKPEKEFHNQYNSKQGKKNCRHGHKNCGNKFFQIFTSFLTPVLARGG